MLGNIDYLMGLNCCYSKGLNTPIIFGGVLTASNQLIEMKNRITEKKQRIHLIPNSYPVII